MIRFLQQYEATRGDYTLEREGWQSSESVDSLVDKIKRSKHQKKE